MNFHDQIPVQLRHFLERHIAKNASIVNHDINSAESIDCCLDNLVAELNRVLVRDGLAASLLNLFDNSVSRMHAVSLSIARNTTAEVVDDHLGATGSKQKSVCTSQTISCTCDNCDFTVKSKFTH